MLLLRQSDEKDAFSLVEAGQLVEAVAACARALEARADDVSALHAWGLAEIKRKSHARAAELLERALAIDASDPFLHNNCGEAHRLAGNLDRAFECYRQALLIDNSNAVPHLNLGIVMHARAKLPEAEHFFRNAVQRAPEMGRPYIELAEIYREEGDAFKALQCYRQGTALAPEYLPWQARLATLLAEQGNTREALALLRRVTGSPEADAPAWYERARIEFELGFEAQALAACERAIGIDPGVSRNAAPRFVCARRTEPRDYCERGGGEYVRLARAQWLRLPPPRSIPPEAAHLWAAGDLIEPLTPELFMMRLSEVALVPRDFLVLAGERDALLDGLVNRPQHYGSQGRYAVQESDDGRLLLDLPSAVKAHENPCAVLGGDGDLFAFFFEGLARLWAIEQREAATGLPLVVPEALDPQRLALLEALGIGQQRLVALAGDTVLRCAEVWIPSLPVVGDWVSPLAVQFLRRKLLGAWPATGRRRRRVYFSRRDCEARRLANEEELLPLLAGKGFETLLQSELTLIDLIAVLREAEAVVALDDPMLAALVVAPQGARIGVIASRGIYRPRAYCVAAQTGQELTYLQAEPVFASQLAHADCDVVLPEVSLRGFLSGL